ncbi:hypothetical protein [Microbacterium hominis]|uniref:hypothetical protein n=1 Tax=Microbacterium hominis TaxID=162426 RepID=UPI000AED6114|nr:hypothetical protein [Microbacterium hominis]
MNSMQSPTDPTTIYGGPVDEVTTVIEDHEVEGIRVSIMHAFAADGSDLGVDVRFAWGSSPDAVEVDVDLRYLRALAAATHRALSLVERTEGEPSA